MDCDLIYDFWLTLFISQHDFIRSLFSSVLIKFSYNWLFSAKQIGSQFAWPSSDFVSTGFKNVYFLTVLTFSTKEGSNFAPFSSTYVLRLDQIPRFCRPKWKMWSIFSTAGANVTKGTHITQILSKHSYYFN